MDNERDRDGDVEEEPPTTTPCVCVYLRQQLPINDSRVVFVFFLHSVSLSSLERCRCYCLLCLNCDSYRALLSSLRSPTPFVIENSALLLHLLSSHAPETAAAIRDAALSSGILLQHFHAAIFSPLEGQRFLSRYLCDLWLSGVKGCDEKRLLKRMVPSGFVGYLAMPMLSRVEEEQLDDLEKDGIEAGPTQASRPTNGNDAGVDDANEMQSTSNGIEVPTGAAGTNTSRLRERIAIATTKASTMGEHNKPENFRIFFHVLTKDHALPDLIWNQQTRRELRIALENELQSIRRETEARGGLDNIAWNHQQFKVSYPSLDDQVKVGNVYMRLWLQAGDGFIKSWDEPERLFEQLFRRLLSEIDRNSTVSNTGLLYRLSLVSLSFASGQFYRLF